MAVGTVVSEHLSAEIPCFEGNLQGNGAELAQRLASPPAHTALFQRLAPDFATLGSGNSVPTPGKSDGLSSDFAR